MILQGLKSYFLMKYRLVDEKFYSLMKLKNDFLAFSFALGTFISAVSHLVFLDFYVASLGVYLLCYLTPLPCLFFINEIPEPIFYYMLKDANLTMEVIENDLFTCEDQRKSFQFYYGGTLDPNDAHDLNARIAAKVKYKFLLVVFLRVPFKALVTKNLSCSYHILLYFK